MSVRLQVSWPCLRQRTRDWQTQESRFIKEVRGDDPEVAAKLRIEERELDGSSALN